MQIPSRPTTHFHLQGLQIMQLCWNPCCFPRHTQDVLWYRCTDTLLLEILEENKNSANVILKRLQTERSSLPWWRGQLSGAAMVFLVLFFFTLPYVIQLVFIFSFAQCIWVAVWLSSDFTSSCLGLGKRPLLTQAMFTWVHFCFRAF